MPSLVFNRFAILRECSFFLTPVIQPSGNRKITRLMTHGARRTLTMPEVLVLSERDAQLHHPARREVCISITDPGKPLPFLSTHFLAVLRLAFSDITEAIDHPNYVLFNERHAMEILWFVSLWGKVDRIVIHCQAGVSRSPGIAAALCELFGWGLPSRLQDRNAPGNRWVRDELIRVGEGAASCKDG